MSASTWNPSQYLTFGDERTRPVVDLLAHVPMESPRDVVDLGCGPGNSTAVGALRWPGAKVRGIDSSPEMIAKARVAEPDLDFTVQDLRSWTDAGEEVDVLFSNATLQWIPDHVALLERLVARVRSGGWLAIGVPGNFAEPSHRLREDIAARSPYAEHLDGIATPSAHGSAVYLRELRRLGCQVDAWETTYLHQLTGEDAVFEWVSGTSLRPTMAALPEPLREPFAEEFKALLRKAYPTEDGLVLLPFRRVFVVAQVA